jgi:aminoglycoside phosphotransferase (APT) family kinase protein
VYFTLGTVFNTESGDLFSRVLAGLRDLPVNVVATVGQHIDPTEFGEQPAGVRIARYLPQAEVLPRCDLVISHGGSGSVIGALAHGLPMVLLPIGADQPHNAEQCLRLGVGKELDPVTVTPQALRAAVAVVLADSSYRQAAERVRAEILELPEPARAVPLMERLVTAPVAGARRMSTVDPTALSCATELAGPFATLDAVQPLAGGSHAKTYLLRTAHPRQEMILREFPIGDRAAADEERALIALDTLGGIAPRLLARGTEDSGSSPWVLISRLPGRADIIPQDPDLWATQLGRTLARIHAAGADVTAGLDTVFERRGYRKRLFGPAAHMVGSAWDDVIVTAPKVLTHGDFQSGNVIWQNSRLTGVIDWEGATRGPAGYDIGWCRLDLYLLYGEELADVFLAAYERASGTKVDDPQLWDLWTLARSHQTVDTWVPNYRDLGRTDLTAAELRQRHTVWTQELVRRRQP